MQIKLLYKYERPDGGITVSLKEPDTPYTTMYRMIADEGKLITINNVDTYSVVDADNVDGWYEIDASEEEFPYE